MAGELFVRALTDQEGRQLRRLIRAHRDARVVRRAQVIGLSARGQTTHPIAEVLERSWSGVGKIIHRFNREGLASLLDKPRAGGPSKATDRYVALLKQAVGQSPRDLGYGFNAWTLERLGEHLARQTRVILSAAHLSNLMRRHRIVYRRPKQGLTHRRDPQEYHEKKAFLEFVKKGRCVRTLGSNCWTSMSVRFTSPRP
jgi:transposase